MRIAPLVSAANNPAWLENTNVLDQSNVPASGGGRVLGNLLHNFGGLRSCKTSRANRWYLCRGVWHLKSNCNLGEIGSAGPSKHALRPESDQDAFRPIIGPKLAEETSGSIRYPILSVYSLSDRPSTG